MGFSQRQVAINGLRFADDPDFLKQCIDAGLNSIYIQFDGVDDVIYRKIEGSPFGRRNNVS